MGVYVLNRPAISCFIDAPVDSRTGERGITGGIQTAIQRGVGFEAVAFSGYYNNVNSPSDVIAVEDYLLAQRTG
jgi:dTDP-glucose pyrophosphorylase